MAINESRTATTPTRGPKDGGKAWCDQHGFNRLLVPFRYRESNPIEIGSDLSEQIRTRRPTAATVAPDEAFDYQPNAEILEFHVRLRGSWRLKRAGRPKYVNPGYVHISSFDHDIIEDTDDRLDVLEQMARSGIPHLRDLAPMFGLSTVELREFCEQYDVDWHETWLRGRERTIRSCCLAVEWGYSPCEVAASLPVKDTVVWHWLQSNALDRVPRDPSFGGIGRADQ